MQSLVSLFKNKTTVCLFSFFGKSNSLLSITKKFILKRNYREACYNIVTGGGIVWLLISQFFGVRQN